MNKTIEHKNLARQGSIHIGKCILHENVTYPVLRTKLYHNLIIQSCDRSHKNTTNSTNQNRGFDIENLITNRNKQ